MLLALGTARCLLPFYIQLSITDTWFFGARDVGKGSPSSLGKLNTLQGELLCSSALYSLIVLSM